MLRSQEAKPGRHADLIKMTETEVDIKKLLKNGNMKEQSTILPSVGRISIIPLKILVVISDNPSP